MAGASKEFRQAAGSGVRAGDSRGGRGVGDGAREEESAMRVRHAGFGTRGVDEAAFPVAAREADGGEAVSSLEASTTAGPGV
jgi:hypothetical protein